MHFRPYIAQVDDAKVDDPLTPSTLHAIPERFRRWLNTVLHAASVTPLPIGR